MFAVFYNKCECCNLVSENVSVSHLKFEKKIFGKKKGYSICN